MRERGMVGARPRRAVRPRTHHDARAARTGAPRNDPALRLRGARRQSLFRRHPGGRRSARRCSISPLHIIDTKKAKFDPSRSRTAYQEAVVELIRAKRAGRPAPTPPTAAPEQCRQPDGCVAAQRRGRQGRQARKRAAPTQPERRAQARAANRRKGRRKATRGASSRRKAG